MSQPYNAQFIQCTPNMCKCTERARGIRRGVLLSMEAIRRNMMWPEERASDRSIPPLDFIIDAQCKATGYCSLDVTTWAQYNHAIRWMLRKEAQRATADVSYSE